MITKLENDNLTLTFPNLIDLYKHTKSENRDPNNCNINYLNDIFSRWDEDWIGISEVDVEKYKYTAKPELFKDLKKIEDTSILGGSSTTRCYSEEDGYDMDYERLYNGLPFLVDVKRNKKGIRNGKVIEIYINIAENCMVDSEAMLNKTRTAVAICDFLEMKGYRVSIYSCTYSRSSGQFDGKTVNIFTKTQIKTPEEPLNKALLTSAISPWMFRCHIFKIYCLKTNAKRGLGCPTKLKTKMTENKQTIIIDSGECLSEEYSDKKIKEIMDLFNKEG